MNKRFLLGLLVLLMGTLACEPVLAIGPNELLCLLILIIVLLGPPLYKFIRRVDEFLKHEKKDK
ncbi:MAG TPA: hypothetical protein VK249_14375 [Anaerolineales bacterium]|nr:hypothetical protein [Anaerolineales bacterium]